MFIRNSFQTKLVDISKSRILMGFPNLTSLYIRLLESKTVIPKVSSFDMLDNNIFHNLYISD